MADLLISNLKKKCEAHSGLMPLVSQWGFDETLIPKALQAVGNMFPHYSRHDVSHSRQILINIERLLGPSVESLSATDTWLLLESAFWHDIGMVVPQKDIDEVFSLEEFQDYLYSIAMDSSNELCRFAKFFNYRDLSTCFIGAESPIHAIECLRNLLAEWFRRNHAERAKLIVELPWKSAGISSPRTELIPARLFRHLGTICHMHGMSFKQMMNDDVISFREMGLGPDDCHPRFVACLLRLGDLLDVDDNRFCPVLQQIAGPRRPSLSKVHEDKHMSIRQLRIDRERIEVVSVCESIPAYLETYRWFDWLKTEFQQQMSYWQDIVPTREFGLLPTIGKIDVRMRKNTNVLAEGQRPQFSIDAYQATELLRGTGLYDSRFDCVRELLQNAVDASLLGFWLSSGQKDAEKFQEPTDLVLNELKQKLQIEVNLYEVEERKDKKTVWCLQVIDHGTGISRSDLPYLLKIGSAQKNVIRQKWISRMPEWMKPSGAFGIGFQSVFMLTECVRVTTKSMFTSETLKMTLHSPMSDAAGLVEIETLSNDLLRPFGTSVEITFVLDTFSKGWNLSWSRPEAIASQLVESVDTMLDRKFQYDAGKLAGKIIDFAKEASVGIVGKVQIHDLNYDIAMQEQTTERHPLSVWKYIKECGVSLRYKPTGVKPVFSHNMECFYRGQPFEQKYIVLPHVLFELNIQKDKASDWLSVSRNSLADNAGKKFNKLVLEAFLLQLEFDTEKLEKLTSIQQSELSFFVEAMCTSKGGKKWIELSKRLQDAWLDLTPVNCTATFKKLLSKKKLLVGVGAKAEQPDGFDVLLEDSYFDYTLPVMMQHWLKNPGHSVQLLAPSESEKAISSKKGNSKSSKNKQKGLEPSFYRTYLFKQEKQPLYSQMALCLELARKLRTVHNNERYYIPWQKFLPKSSKKLILNKKSKITARPLFEIIGACDEYILLPYLFKTAGFRSNSESVASLLRIEEFAKIVSKYLKETISADEILPIYEELDSFLDEMMVDSPYKHLWKVER